jgi:hypothetical protein
LTSFSNPVTAKTRFAGHCDQTNNTWCAIYVPLSSVNPLSGTVITVPYGFTGCDPPYQVSRGLQ